MDMEALFLNILNEYHAQEVETKKKIYLEAWKAFTAYHMNANNWTEEEVETIKRAFKRMKRDKRLQSHFEEETWKAFTAYRKKHLEEKGEKSTGLEGPSG